MSTPIVIDEWLFSDLRGKNGKDKQFQTFNFIVKLLEICDKIVILRGSPVERKFYEFVKYSNIDLDQRLMCRFFNTGIIVNSTKTIYISEDEIQPLPSKLTKKVPDDDKYLFQAHLRIKGSVLVTTDNRLFKKVRNQNSISIFMRDGFIENYLKQ